MCPPSSILSLITLAFLLLTRADSRTVQDSEKQPVVLDMRSSLLLAYTYNYAADP